MTYPVWARWRAFGRAVILLGLVAAVAGCSSTAKQVAVPYAVELTAAKDVNPDARGRASPIQVTIFELRSSNQFEAKDYFTLLGNAQAALGVELLDTETVILKPGESRVVRRPGNVQARVIGVVAAYRDLDESGWRRTVNLPEPQNTNIYKVWQFSPSEEPVPITVGREGMEVIQKPRSWWSIF
ncbi:type VI secretion system-associated lipoprotein [Bordetella genomosp. 1]|uniref:Type VI secretion system-associated lipoprotein n=1 Tax=Bordetella genomosp. 1 TaxID=1395607 RepID=A0A261SE94_9BORD|nr:type VI secretion system lipoprotein TssJ [Bordetella genomosp. 1]MDQ8033627.1 type VI secretion system lipoprotein TssJ [Bordetella sp.]OZI35317.1 type VI secretion system-associated lipoprotein [Bordetella genomosp. 1]OZI63857.1 type VI secretion system-associated lipoprotein [Bordetella genomosp. 1]